ncbi:SH3 domain-containing protein [Phormidium sp. FACHB-592]|uniref:SH3 domain-containing protein n=1 Tax=Stenomitos frigidus AS-A4 TaxID=2933935 RepID=A0ABV0KTG0_9CYAN|nr:SH3 domain-containing protein [Phormidium sp. FACHB-592]MBD2073426.1 SH3 domain-containing protein [Phormidium sp. FACHB-592]
MTNPIPGEGPFFTLNPVPPPQPSAARSWGLPLALGLLAIPLLMFGFGFSQQQLPDTTSPTVIPSVSPLPTPSLASRQDATTPQSEASVTPPLVPSSVATPLPLAAPSSDPATFPITRIQSLGVAANFRAAPGLQSQVLGVLLHSDLVELTPDRRVQQDGVVWVPVRWRGQSGWLASNFLGDSTHAQP